MQKPKVELKNLKTFRGMEGIGINVDVWINGVKCLLAMDAGDGGEMEFEQNYDHKNQRLVKENIKLLDDYIDSLPEIKYNLIGKESKMKVGLETFINDLLLEQEEKKEKKRLVKMFENTIVVGKPNCGSYTLFKQKQPLSKFPTALIQSLVDMVKVKYCVNGKQILNTNLESIGIKI